MSNTARSLLLIGAFVALLASEYGAAYAIGHHVAFISQPAIVPEPSLLEHPLLRMAFIVVSLGALLELLVGNPIPLHGWLWPFDRMYRDQHRMYLCGAVMALIAIMFTYVLIQGSYLLETIFVWVIVALDLVFALMVAWRVFSWCRTSRGRSLAAE